MNNVTPFPGKHVKFRACPGCGTLLSQLEIESFPHGMNCPRCELWNVDEFEPACYETFVRVDHGYHVGEVIPVEEWLPEHVKL